MADIVLEPVRPDSPLGAAALRRYVTDILTRIHGRAVAEREVDEHLAADPSDHLLPPAGVLVVARDAGDEVLGCAGLRLCGSDVPSGAGEVKRMFVAPAARGAGLGTRLLSHLGDLAREAGLSRLVLDTRDELTEARRLYVRHGFVEVEPYNENPYARNWYAKDLS